MADIEGIMAMTERPRISASIEMLFREEVPGPLRDRLRASRDIMRSDRERGLLARVGKIVRLLMRPGQADPTAARIRACKAAGGIDAVEFASWTDKNIGAIAVALRETGLRLTGFAAPTCQLADPAAHPAFLKGLRESLAVAHRLGASHLIVVPGNALPNMDRGVQREAVKQALLAGALLADQAGVTLIVEPVNSRADHVSIFLDRVRDGLDLVADVAHPAVRLLFDSYHSAVMGEDPTELFTGNRGALVGHVHLADVPGRGEPGSGRLVWASMLEALFASGYAGAIGFEYRATSGRTVASLQRALSRIRTPAVLSQPQPGI